MTYDHQVTPYSYLLRTLVDPKYLRLITLTSYNDDYFITTIAKWFATVL